MTANIPLAEKLRPKSLEDWIGHSEVMAPGLPLYEAIRSDQLFSFILYAPPGSGKTTLCQMIRHYSKARFHALSAVTAGVKDVKAAIEEAKMWRDRQDRDSILFIDEIHRFNKGQQDALLGAVERGEIVLVGATTENPSFELNAALLSRCRVFRWERLSQDELIQILQRAWNLLQQSKAQPAPALDQKILKQIALASEGDARAALNLLERSLPEPSEQKIRKLTQTKTVYHDKTGDLHYEVVSAFIKSMRAGQTDAALYYMARMWLAGEDPLFIARRMLIFASEDIGNADLRAIALANAVRHAVEFIGRPESYYHLAQGVIYLSKAAKSREAGDRFQKALALAERSGSQRPPGFLTNAVTKLDRELGKGRAREENESFLPLDLQEEEMNELT